jgi:NADH-quinone oxidoreductase subunit M
VLTVNNLSFPLLTVMLFLPAAGGVLVLLFPEGDGSSETRTWTPAKVFALLISLATFALSVFMLVKFQTAPKTASGLPASSGWTIQFAEHHTWFPTLGISYYLAIDGLNVWLVPLATTVMSIAIFASCLMINRRAKLFMSLMLIAETGVLGVFLSFNVFLFYIFWEVMLIPAYLLLGVWGESKRVYATTKFVVFTIFGSFIMLVAIIYLFATTPAHNLDVPYLIAHPLSGGQQDWLFLAFMLAFAIKAPLWPFHSWAADAYTESPVPVSVLFASVLSKTATFSILRFCLPIFPHGSRDFAALISILAIIGLLYAATIALVQIDIKRTLAYASISHMNIILLGIFALNQQGIDGSILQMVNHAVIMAGLFFMVAMVYARSGTRRLDEMSGLAKTFPVMAAFLLLLFLAGMDLPGLGSFAGEFTILIGVFLANAWFATIAALVTIVAAWYMVRWFQGIVHGPVGPSVPDTAASDDDASTVYEYPVRKPRIRRDLRTVEMVLLVPLAVVIIWLGVLPKPVTDRTAPTVTQLSALVHKGR